MTISNSFKELAGGDLADFTPRPTPTHPETQQLERLAAREGFDINNLPIKRKVLQGGRIPSADRPQPMTLRLRTTDWNKFSAYCERNGYTVADAFERLTALIDSERRPSTTSSGAGK